MLWIVLFIPVLSGYAWDKSVNIESSGKDLTPPSFEAISTKIDATIGETVLLPCTVRNLGDKVVSWIRTVDLSILTSGAYAFSSDNRFESVYSKDEDSWGLRIRGVKLSDAGQYECQVNTDPKINLAYTLSVTDVKSPAGINLKYSSIALIKSSREVYVRVGSPVSLSCEITPSPGVEPFPPEKSRVLWLHDGREITSESDRGGISVDTDYRERKITSRLRVSMVTVEDGGFYTCTHPNTRKDSIKLHVFQGEHTEAMQRDAAYSSATTKYISNVPIIIYLLLYL